MSTKPTTYGSLGPAHVKTTNSVIVPVAEYDALLELFRAITSDMQIGYTSRIPTVIKELKRMGVK